jgi:hypothetical protein
MGCALISAELFAAEQDSGSRLSRAKISSGKPKCADRVWEWRAAFITIRKFSTCSSTYAASRRGRAQIIFMRPPQG